MPNDAEETTRAVVWFPDAPAIAVILGLLVFFPLMLRAIALGGTPSLPAALPHIFLVWFLSGGALTALYLPLAVVFDAEAGEIRIRTLLRVKRISLNEADGIKLLYDGGSSLVRYSLVYRKEFMRPPLPLCALRQGVEYLSAFRQRPLYNIQEVLFQYRQRRPAVPPPAASPAGPTLWRRHEEKWVLMYPAAVPQVLVLLLPVPAFSFAFYAGWITAAAHLILTAIGEDCPETLEFVCNAAFGAVCFLCAGAAMLVPAGVWVDQAKGRLARFRFFPLIRKRYSLDDFECFTFTEDMFLQALCLRFRNCRKPVNLRRSRSPEVLRQVLFETAGLLGRDPWESFVPHGREHTTELFPR